ncbi:hypothetical protein BC831DRAFT_136952 [Entophlyctis helioformis]|nr:hypothetical protein BC831DRAFT_136952 [Entophlyctis helioformis]
MLPDATPWITTWPLASSSLSSSPPSSSSSSQSLSLRWQTVFLPDFGDEPKRSYSGNGSASLMTTTSSPCLVVGAFVVVTGVGVAGAWAVGVVVFFETALPWIGGAVLYETLAIGVVVGTGLATVDAGLATVVAGLAAPVDAGLATVDAGLATVVAGLAAPVDAGLRPAVVAAPAFLVVTGLPAIGVVA